MKSQLKLLFLTLLVLFSFEKSICQSVDNRDSTGIKLIQSARDIMISAGLCALITVDEEGRPRVRTMDPFQPDENLVVWFGTNPLSRKVEQIKSDPRVTLYYLDKDSSGYVMIHGTAELVDNPDVKNLFWKESWTTFYPNYPDGYLLIKVSPEWMEVISFSRGIFGDPSSWNPPVVTF